MKLDAQNDRSAPQPAPGGHLRRDRGRDGRPACLRVRPPVQGRPSAPHHHAEAAQHGEAAGQVVSQIELIDEVVETREELREQARRTLGVSGETKSEPLRRILREHHLSIYPLAALGLLVIIDQFQSYAFTVLTPEISRALGLSLAAIAGARTIQFLAIAIAPLPMAALAQRRARRALLCIITGLAWSLITLYTGFVVSLFGLLIVLVLGGLSSGSVLALHSPLLIDSYPPRARVRVLSAYSGFAAAGSILSPLLVGFFAGALGLTWRGVFLA